MENKETILTELQQISEVVANLPKGNTFAVPDNYFDHFPATVLSMIHAETADLGSKSTPLSVPQGYFDGLADNILLRIKQQDQSVEEELNELAPLLNTISKRPVYTVPEGYFESLEVTVPLAVAKPQAKVFGLGKPKRILQYAVAACTAAILMIGAYLYTSKGTDASGEMAISYDSAMNMNVNQELANLNTQEIDAYLNEAPGVGYVVNTSFSADESLEVEEFIETVSEEEIKEYLNEAPATEVTAGS